MEKLLEYKHEKTRKTFHQSLIQKLLFHNNMVSLLVMFIFCYQDLIPHCLSPYCMVCC